MGNREDVVTRNMRSLLDDAEGRELTADEAERYKELERLLKVARDLDAAQPLLDGLEASLRQFEALSQKISRLCDAQEDTERHVIHRTATLWHDGCLQLSEVQQTYDRILSSGSTLEDFETEWELAGLPSELEMDDWLWTPRSWRSVDGDVPPQRGVCVVYILYDAKNMPCYVGSTKDLRSRLKAHRRAGKPTNWWAAHECKDRAAAFEMEDRLLKDQMPYLNIRRGR
jgi:hypothetical protein